MSAPPRSIRPTPLLVGAGLGLVAAVLAASTTRPSSRTRAIRERVAFPSAEVICAATFLDEEIEQKRGNHVEVMQKVRVTRVFYGDPALKTALVQKQYSQARPGDRAILALRSAAYGRRSTSIPDTPENRRAILAMIEAHQRPPFARRFIDREKLLAAGEGLLREYLAGLAEKYPDHPHIGRRAAGQVRISRCPAPLGAYLLVTGGLRPVKTDRGRADVPRGNGLILWVGVGTDRQRGFRIGLPEERIRRIDTVTVNHTESGHRIVRVRPADLRSPLGPLSLHLHTVVPDPDGRGRFDEDLHMTFHGLQKRLDALNRDPPRELAAAIACLAQSAPRPPAGKATGVLLLRPDPAPRLYEAYAALGSPFSLGHLSDAQRARLVPLLIDRLTDTTVVRNKTRIDGPITLAHHLAYPLLCAVTGRKFPPVLRDPPMGGRRPPRVLPTGPVPAPPDPAQEQAEAARRHQVWRDWWAAEGSRGFSPATRPGDEAAN